MSEFKLKSFTFEHVYSRSFVESQWRIITPKFFTGYRITLAIALIVWLIFDFTTEWLNSYQGYPYYWLLLATNWSFIMLVLAHLSLAFACMMNNCDSIMKEEVFGYKFCWFVYNVATNTVLTTSIIYFFALVNSDQAIFNTTQSKLKHGLNAAVVLFDLWLSAVPVRLYHAVYPLVLGTAYTVLLVVHYAAGGQAAQARPYVYRALYWRHPGPAAVALVCAVIVSLLVQLLTFMLVQARLWLARKLQGEELDYGPDNGPHSDVEPIIGQEHNTYSAIE